MNSFNREFIRILNAGLTNKPVKISSDFDWDKAISVAKEHNIVTLLYYGAVNCNISTDEKYMQELYRLTLRSSIVSVRQMYEIERIQEAFDREGIEYMPLKGIILKELYPKPEMRAMGDADILIKLEQYPKIEDIMTSLGFAFQYESDHELVWERPTLFLELHKRIMTTYNKDFYAYFGSGWKRANRIANTCRYEMSVEDFFIFAFVHFTKHYRISGIGIKHLIDLWVYSSAHTDMNWAYIERELKIMRLSDFYHNIRKTLNVWFCDESDTEISDLITNVIFNSGQYGSEEMAIVNRAMQNGNTSVNKMKLTRLVKNIFLPYSEMKVKYKILKVVPILLPVMWLIRWVGVLLFKRVRLKRYLDTMGRIESTDLENNRKALHIVGLDFDNLE